MALRVGTLDPTFDQENHLFLMDDDLSFAEVVAGFYNYLLILEMVGTEDPCTAQNMEKSEARQYISRKKNSLYSYVGVVRPDREGEAIPLNLRVYGKLLWPQGFEQIHGIPGTFFVSQQAMNYTLLRRREAEKPRKSFSSNPRTTRPSSRGIQPNQTSPGETTSPIELSDYRFNQFRRVGPSSTIPRIRKAAPFSR